MHLLTPAACILSNSCFWFGSAPWLKENMSPHLPLQPKWEEAMASQGKCTKWLDPLQLQPGRL